MFVPDGFAIVTPYIFATGAEAYIAFLTEAFGAIEVRRSCDPSGRIANSQMNFYGTMIMVSEDSEAFPATKASYYLYVADADRAMARAVRAGAVEIMAVDDMPYGDRQGGVRDPQGNIWWISQRLTDAPYA